jgi:CheY-like chemotaxis protein
MTKIKKLRAKVLIIDDDELICTLMKLYLTGLGEFEFWVSHNGLAGLNMARQIQPDLIISDITMPIMDGIMFLSAIRRDEKLKKIPTIMVSGTSDDLKARAYEAGADMVLEKPLVRKYMINAIEKLLPKPK